MTPPVATSSCWPVQRLPVRAAVLLEEELEPLRYVQPISSEAARVRTIQDTAGRCVEFKQRFAVERERRVLRTSDARRSRKFPPKNGRLADAPGQPDA